MSTISGHPDVEDDASLVARVLQGETSAFELLMRRHNQQLYRATLAILGNPAEAEDAMQDAYVQAYQHLESFEGRARFSTWLTRIAVNAARMRLRGRGRIVDGEDPMETFASANPGPEAATADRELRAVLEDTIAALPPAFRAVFVLRSVEGMSVKDTADVLEIPEETVKTRHFRARALLQEAIATRFETSAAGAFPFHLQRCDRIVHGVLARIAALPPRRSR